MKRFIVLFIILTTLIGLDIVSKYYFDNISWEWYCYASSPYIVTDSWFSINRLTGNCFQDSQTWHDFYGSVYKDIYTPIIGKYLWFQLSYNKWIAFSLPIHGLPLQIITALLVLWIIYQYFREEYQKKSKILDTGYILIFAGAISHTFERIFVGHVVDFIAVKYFAILNFADIFISVWVFLIILSYVRQRNHR